MAAKTRFHSKWKVDQDYKSKLSREEKAWLEKFNSEFYRASIGKNPLHTTKEQRKQIYDAQNAAWTDIVTQSDEVVAAHLAKHAKPSRHTYYSPDDYPTEQQEDDDVVNQ